MTPARIDFFSLIEHLVTAPNAPLPPDLRLYLLAAIASHLKDGESMDVALGVREPSRPTAGRQWRVAQRNEHLRATGMDASTLKLAISRYRRRAPGRRTSEVDRHLAEAERWASLPESVPQLRRILG
ncbi:hypothetical protein [Thiorhodovibrio frisius]|uniref:Uncharacterized protein n=1 Tax=Thiorhodovibrio frisius TaxID=631362 RepID=H8YXV6_9GAMM|nr:hypothetical protein [Thiorhodovibrio frisius]EIC23282.1 hypothetical protein Thi970DRAFT_00938 [Thiorhodovibrio frisius]WPL23641.1 hypothetical protein Thiofri_03836 [Thiorhodovibrio frisius]